MLETAVWYSFVQIDYFDLLINQEEKKFASNIEPTFEPLFTVNRHNGCFQMKVNESHAEVLGDKNKFFNPFFDAVANAINRDLKVKQADNSCLNEEDAKMVRLFLKYFNHSAHTISLMQITNHFQLFA